MPQKLKPKLKTFKENRKPIASDFGTYLRNLRVSRNLTLKDLSGPLNLAAKTIGNIECGYNPPPRPARLKIWLRAVGYPEKYNEALAFLSAIRNSRTIQYQPRNGANEHIDRLIDAYESGTLSNADINLLRMIAPDQYNRT